MTKNASIYHKLIWLVAFATILLHLWGNYRFAPQIIKLIYIFPFWLSVFVYPKSWIKHNDYGKYVNLIIRLLLGWCLILVIRSCLNDSADMYAFGNKWATLFFNDHCAPLFLPLIFIYSASNPYMLVTLKKIIFIFPFMSVINFFVGYIASPAQFTFFIAAFWDYVKRKYRFIIIGIFVVALIHALLGTRMYFLVVAYSLVAYILVHWFDKPIILKIYCFILLLSPLFLFMPLLEKKASEETSFFKEMQKNILQQSDKNEKLVVDTRTFLYLEMALDLRNESAWLVGKGAYAHYYSLFFDRNTLGRYGRIGSEVPFLNNLLHGGIIFEALYLAIFFIAIWRGLRYGKSKFVRLLALLFTGWVFNHFIGDTTGCRLYHIIIYSLLGCCLSKKWLNFTDKEILNTLK